MTLPAPTAPGTPKGIAGWIARVERALADLDSRVSTRRGTGTAAIWLGGDLPPGLLAADGSVVNRADYPGLFDAIGTTYNTGGESSDTFRLPNFTTPPEHGVWTVRT